MLSPHPAQWVDGLPRPLPYAGETVIMERSEPLQNECRHFLDCIRENLQPKTNAIEGCNVLTVLEAASQSMATRLPVNLPYPAEQGISKQADIPLSEVVLEGTL